MARVHVTQPTEVILNGATVAIAPNIYNIDNLEFCKVNDFMQCGKCKEWFDEISTIGIYHPDYDERKQKDYCSTCFTLKYN